MDKRYRAAVIGCGRAGGTGSHDGGCRIGYTHARMHQANPRVDLVAAADIDPANLAVFCDQFGVPGRFDDYRAMLAAVRPDLVSISTWVGLHCGMIEDCARAGVRGIVCEKPFVAAPGELQRVADVAAETGVKIVVCHIRRYLLAFRRARELYLGGTLGEPVLVAAGIEDWELAEWGSHWLDMFRFFHGDAPVEWVMGQVRYRGKRGFGHAMEEHGLAYCQFAGGGKALLDGGHGLHGGETMRLVATRGCIGIESEHRLRIHDAAGERVEEYPHDWHGIWDQMLAELLTWLEGGPESQLGHANMLKSAELMLAAYVSAVSRDRVDLPMAWAGEGWPMEVLESDG